MRLELSESMTTAFEISSILLAGSRSHSTAAFTVLPLADGCGPRREKSSLSTNSNIVSKNSKLRAQLRPFVILLRISGFSLSNTRLPASTEKQTILRAIEVAGRTLQLPVILRVLRLSPRRYHNWTNAAKECCLEDVTSCPRTTPQQLTPTETRVIKEMATSHGVSSPGKYLRLSIQL